jgi:hypothetical protein
VKVLKDENRLGVIKLIHKQAPPGSEDGICSYDVDWLIRKVDKYEVALEEITRQYDNVPANRAKEIAISALGVLSDKRRKEIQGKNKNY